MILSQLFLSIVLVDLHTAFTSPTDLAAKERQFERYEMEYKTKSNLNYGDRCHSEEVEMREIIKKSLDKMSEIPITSLSLMVAEYKEMNQAMKYLLSTGYDLCNEEKLLACDKTTNRCSCGVTEYLFNQEFSFVRNSNGDCLFAKDSSCLPVNDTPGEHDTCASDTRCILKNKWGALLDCDKPNYSNAIYIGDTDKMKLPHCQCKRI